MRYHETEYALSRNGICVIMKRNMRYHETEKVEFWNGKTQVLYTLNLTVCLLNTNGLLPGVGEHPSQHSIETCAAGNGWDMQVVFWWQALAPKHNTCSTQRISVCVVDLVLATYSVLYTQAYIHRGHQVKRCSVTMHMHKTTRNH